MAKRNRETLKNFFKKGSLPKEEHFSDLIDSSLNIIDEGFAKSMKKGLEVRSVGDSENLISFFNKTEEDTPNWTIALNKQTDNLEILNKDNERALSISSDGKIGVGTKTPEYTFDINGVLAAKANIGTFKAGKAPADGKWHPILSDLKGCQALEIMAGVGKKGSGNYALAHTIALNTFFSKKRIKTQQAYYSRRCNRIQFRWTGDKSAYNLEMRTRMDYGSDISVRYHISQKWLDTFMDG